MKKKDKIIIGIDPGTQIMGYSLICNKNNKLEIINFGIIELKKIKDPYKKLQYIFERTKILIKEFHPEEMAIEAPFYGKNAQSMLKLGRAQGVAIAAALANNLDVYEYSPRKIKQSITGNGNASKEQIALMLANLFNLKEIPKYFDSTDALAVAVCHAFQNTILTSKKTKSWHEFIQKNKDRIL